MRKQIDRLCVENFRDQHRNVDMIGDLRQLAVLLRWSCRRQGRFSQINKPASAIANAGVSS
jgi:hypothetical protein